MIVTLLQGQRLPNIVSASLEKPSILGKTGSFISIIELGFIATIAALPCTIGPFTDSSTTYLTRMTTMENNLYTALFSFAFVIPMILVFVAIYAVKVITDRVEEWRMKSARYMRLSLLRGNLVKSGAREQTYNEVKIWRNLTMYWKPSGIRPW